MKDGAKQDKLNRKKKQLLSNMESIQIIYEQDYDFRKFKSEILPNSSEDYNDKSKNQDGSSSNETRVLSQMCNCIQSNQTRLNGYIRRMFSLENVLM